MAQEIIGLCWWLVAVMVVDTSTHWGVQVLFAVVGISKPTHRARKCRGVLVAVNPMTKEIGEC